MKTNQYEGKPCEACGSRIRYKSNNICVECRKASNKQYRKSGKGKEARQRCLQAEEQKEKHKQHVLRYQATEKGKASILRYERSPKRRLLARGYSHQRRGGGNIITPEAWLAILESHNFTCYLCREHKKTLHIEHKIPLSRGGTNDLDNLAPACPPCNFSKGAKTDTEYLATKNKDVVNL